MHPSVEFLRISIHFGFSNVEKKQFPAEEKHPDNKPACFTFAVCTDQDRRDAKTANEEMLSVVSFSRDKVAWSIFFSLSRR